MEEGGGVGGQVGVFGVSVFLVQEVVGERETGRLTDVDAGFTAVEHRLETRWSCKDSPSR